MGTEKKFITTGDFARLHGVPLHRITYLVQSRGIRPVMRAGVIRLFSQEQLEPLCEEIERPASIPEVRHVI